MSKKNSPDTHTEYQRGKVKISGNSSDARRLMYIDLISSKLFWIAVFIASLYLGYETKALTYFFDFVRVLFSGGPRETG